MLPELTGMTLEAAEAALQAEGIAYSLRRTVAPFSRGSSPEKVTKNYAVRFDQGELTYASFPVLSPEGPREGQE